MRRSRYLAALLALVSLAACRNESMDLPPDIGVFRALHAIPAAGVLTLTLDDNELGDFDFNQIRGIIRPGDLNHQVLIDVKLPGADSPTERLETLSVATAVDRVTTLVVNGTIDHPNVLTWQQPARDWATEAADATSPLTVLEVSYGNASLSRGALDFYLGPKNFDPTTSTPVASLDYSELQAKSQIDAGSYQVVVTPSGDPTTELYRSAELALPAATSLLFVAYDSDLRDDSGTPWLSVRSLGDGFSNLQPNQKVPGLVRVLHAAADTGPLDVFTTDDQVFLISGLAFGSVSPYAIAPFASTSFTITPTGQPDDAVSGFFAGGLPTVAETMMTGGAPDALFTATFIDDTRRVVTEAKVRLLQASTNVTIIDAYFVDPGASIDNVPPTTFALNQQLASISIPMAAGSYDLVITQSNTKDIVGGPTRVTFKNNGLYGIVITDAPQEGHVSTFFIDDDPVN